MNELLLSSETILDSLSEGVYVCDRDRRIVFITAIRSRVQFIHQYRHRIESLIGIRNLQ